MSAAQSDTWDNYIVPAFAGTNPLSVVVFVFHSANDNQPPVFFARFVFELPLRHFLYPL